MIENKKLGYYTCNGVEFSSKVQGALYATTVKQPLNWHFNNEVFNNYKWHIEPDSSLQQLYYQRARQLREKYDYLVLSYSGGSDSNNILMSFYEQGLHLDEIVTNWVLNGGDKHTVLDTGVTAAWNQNAEYELHTRERLKWVSTNLPRTKISCFDYGKHSIDYFVGKDESWVLDAGDSLNPGVMQRFNYLNLKDLRSRVDHYQSVGVIIGIDKPKCRIQDNRLFLFFNDKTANLVPMDLLFNKFDYTNTTTELFYWAPESCDILAKQCHALLKFLNNNPEYRTYWETVALEARLYQEKFLRTIIYNNWNTNWFQGDKSIKDWDCELDDWFFAEAGASAISSWNNGLNYLEKNLAPEFVLQLQSQSTRGLKFFTTPFYYVGKLSSIPPHRS